MTELTDDGRRWWVCSAATWESITLIPAPHKRAALTEYRRMLTAGERANGTSGREIRQVLAHAGLSVHETPLTTPHAFMVDLAQFLGYEATRWSTGREVIVPAVDNPAAVAEAVDLLTAELGDTKASRMRTQLLDRYLKGRTVTDIVVRLHEAALPYGAELVDAAAEEAAKNLSASYTQDMAEIGITAHADRLRVDRVMTNLERTTLAIADAHASCRRKNCRVCAGIRIMLVEHIALRTSQIDTLPQQIAPRITE